MPTGLGAQPGGEFLGQFHREVTGRHGRRRCVGGGEQARPVQPGQCRAPGGLGGGLVLPVQPGQVLAVGGDRGQGGAVSVGRVQLEQLTHQDRHGPAVHQDVVLGEEEAVPVLREPEQTAAHQGRTGQVEPRGPVRGEQPVQLGALPVRVGLGRQVGLRPGERDLVRHDLHGAAESLVAERGPQVGVAAQQCLRGRAQCGDVQRPFQVEAQLHGVDVRCALVVQRVEEQSFLQRRERQYVGESLLRH